MISRALSTWITANILNETPPGTLCVTSRMGNIYIQDDSHL